MSVSTIITDKGVDGTYTYECKHCGGSTKVHRHSDNAGGLSIVPVFYIISIGYWMAPDVLGP